MNIRSLLAVAFLGAATTAFAESSAPASATQFYADASVIGAFPGEGLGNAAGEGLAIGVTLHQVHSIEAEVMHFKSSAGSGANIKFIPILATYKYAIPLAPKLSVNAGASVGVMHERAHRPGWGWLNGGSDNAFAYGLSAGIAYDLTETIALTGSVRTLQLASTDYTTSGGITIISGGLSFRF
jgi:opacity protein-like surface antigen